MGNGLFDNYGVDIAGLVDEHLSPGMLPLVIKHQGAQTEERPAGQLTKPPERPADTSHSGRGMISDFQPSEFASSQLLEAGDRKVLVIVESLKPPVEPGTGDTVQIEGRTYRVARLLKRDPAAATYTLQVRDM